MKKLLALLGCAGLFACDGDVQITTVPAMRTVPMVDNHGRPTPAVCPGAQGCESGDGPLMVGAAAETITPTFETWDDLDGDGVKDPDEPFDDADGDGQWDAAWMAGFDMGRAANGVHDDLWARTLVFAQGDMLVGMVSFDTLGVFQADVNALRAAAEPLGFDHVIVAATHNHEAEDTMGISGPDPGTTGRDPAYLEHIITRAVAGLEASLDNMVPVTVTVGQSTAPDLIDDSRLPEVKDPTITTLRFDADDGGTVATWTFWGNHPEALGGDNHIITSDYPHYLRTGLEDQYPGSVAVFSAGNLGGLMNPLHIAGCPDENGDETCPSGTFELADYIGTNVAGLAGAALSDGRSVTPTLSFTRMSYFTQVDNLRLVLALKVGLVERDGFLPDGTFVEGERLRELPIEDIRDGGMLINTELNILRFGDVTIVTIPGELYPELWLEGPEGSLVERPAGGDFPDAPIDPALLSLFGDDETVVAINNANDALGYIIPKAQFDEAPPFAYKENGQYGEINSIGPDMGHDLYMSLQELLGLQLR